LHHAARRGLIDALPPVRRDERYPRERPCSDVRVRVGPALHEVLELTERPRNRAVRMA
jgi:hypothetical protein